MTSSSALALLLGAACTDESLPHAAATFSAAAMPPARVILISVDTLRADHLGIYGYERNTSPHIDRFFEPGTTYLSPSATAPCTIPSVRQTLYGAFDVRENRAPLAEILSEHGHRTGAVVSQHQFWKDGLARYSRGFDRFDIQAVEDVDHHGMTARDATQVSDRALAWLDANSDAEKLFLWLHYFDPHDPYEPPEQFRALDRGNRSPRAGDVRNYRKRRLHFDGEDTAHFVNLYDGEIQYVDAQIGRVFEYLESRDLVDRSLVVLTADHGEWLGERNRWGHCKTLREPETRVPMLVRLNGGALSIGNQSSSPVSTLDVLPTVLGALGIETREDLYHGVDLSESPSERTVLAFWRTKQDLVWEAIRSGKWKLDVVDGIAMGLYDLDADPEEASNLMDREPGVMRTLSQQLATQRDLANSVGYDNRKIIEQLEQIGYIQ